MTYSHTDWYQQAKTKRPASGYSDDDDDHGHRVIIILFRQISQLFFYV